MNRNLPPGTSRDAVERTPTLESEKPPFHGLTLTSESLMTWKACL
jgi:hypothetical protein